MRFISLFTVISCISFTLACGGGDEETSTSDPLCDPGTTQICVGSGVCEGVQVCNLNGSAWGECNCGGGEAGSPGTGGAETGGNEPGGAEPGTGGTAGSEPDDGGAETGGSDEPTGGSEPETGGTAGEAATGGTAGEDSTGGAEAGAATGGAGAEAGAATGGTTEGGSGTGGEVCVPVYDRTDPELACQLKAMELAGISIEDLQDGAEMPDACGYIDDGCGNPINCNGCAEYKGCGVGEIVFLENAYTGNDITMLNKTPSLCQGGCVGMFNEDGETWVSCTTTGNNSPNPSQIQWATVKPPYEITVCYDETDDFAALEGLADENLQIWACDISIPER